MKDCVVAKFGGSSLANSKQIEKVFNIVKECESRKYIVVSAPGKDKTDKVKVTDALINIGMNGNHDKKVTDGQSKEESVSFVIQKFESNMNLLDCYDEEIISSLKNDLSRTNFGSEKQKLAFLASRGEHNQAKLFAKGLKKRGINATVALPENFGYLLTGDFSNGIFDINNVSKNTEIAKYLNSLEGKVIIPGYYGISKDKEIMVHSRGGSDTTGGNIAGLLAAKTYENWTDTDGVYAVDPRIVSFTPKIISKMTYKEMRMLSNMGFSVLHPDAVRYCKKAGVPINIRNTNNPCAKGTFIVGERVPLEDVVGIAVMANVAYVYIEKDMMDEEVGFTEKCLDVFRKLEIATHYYPAGKDEIAIVVNQNDLNGEHSKVEILKNTLIRELNPDFCDIKYNLAILNPVGIGMKNKPGVFGKVSNALGYKNINIEFADQSPSQNGILLGINNYEIKTAVEALYGACFR